MGVLIARSFTSSSLAGTDVGPAPSCGVDVAPNEGLAVREALFKIGVELFFAIFSFLAASKRFLGVGRIEFVIVACLACFSLLV